MEQSTTCKHGTNETEYVLMIRLKDIHPVKFPFYQLDYWYCCPDVRQTERLKLNNMINHGFVAYIPLKKSFSIYFAIWVKPSIKHLFFPICCFSRVAKLCQWDIILFFIKYPFKLIWAGNSWSFLLFIIIYCLSYVNFSVNLSCHVFTAVVTQL